MNLDLPLHLCQMEVNILQHHKTDSEFLGYSNLLSDLIAEKVCQDYLYTYLEASARCLFGSSHKRYDGRKLEFELQCAKLLVPDHFYQRYSSHS